MRVVLVVSILVLSVGSTLNGSYSELSDADGHFSYKTSVVQHEYIVRFHGYKDHSEHHVLLSAVLGDNSECKWGVKERTPLAMTFPSDFALLKIDPYSCTQEQQTTVLAQLAAHQTLNGVTPQRHVRRLLSNRRRMHTHFSFEEEEEAARMDETGDYTDDRQRVFSLLDDDGGGSLPEVGASRRLLQQAITDQYSAKTIWDHGHTGKGIKVAVFDTGISADHPSFNFIDERSNWTDEDILEDKLGHGTFVAGVIAAKPGRCGGFAPDASINTFRVFTSKQASFTSWFLDAFNYAIFKDMDVLNLSIGGPDFLDRPFVEKVNEVTANNIVMISAIGNDGPYYGTLNNPADQMDVLGVGGVDKGGGLSRFSSRGMTTWELPRGYGRVKPDIVAAGTVWGSNLDGRGSGCKMLSGTSVASPVVAGAVALLASVPPPQDRHRLVNPASIKQILTGAAETRNGNIFEQGFGELSLERAYDLMSTYEPHASILPSKLDFTDEACPYMWPFCKQPVYHSGMPLIVNMTILNGMGVFGVVEHHPVWVPEENGELLDMSFTHSNVLWPWTGYLSVFASVRPAGRAFTGVARGHIKLAVVSMPEDSSGEKGALLRTHLRVPVSIDVIPTPPRHKRILWDQYHSLRYPSGYFPRDNLGQKRDILDWHGDHPHTNFHAMFDHLREHGYFVEVLGQPLTCFEPSLYGTLLIVDSEEYFFAEEVEALQRAVREDGLSVAVFAEWFNADVMEKIKFFDDNTQENWFPVTGGGNIPGLNGLMAPFGIQFGDKVINGPCATSNILSGTHIIEFPAGGKIASRSFEDQGASLLGVRRRSVDAAYMGMLQVPSDEDEDPSSGRVFVYSDSSCLDSMESVNCFDLLLHVLEFTGEGTDNDGYFDNNEIQELADPLRVEWGVKPSHPSRATIDMYSKATRYPAPVCGLYEAEPQHLNELDEFSNHMPHGPQPEKRMPIPRSFPRSSEIDTIGGGYSFEFIIAGASLLLLALYIVRRDYKQGAVGRPKSEV